MCQLAAAQFLFCLLLFHIEPRTQKERKQSTLIIKKLKLPLINNVFALIYILTCLFSNVSFAPSHFSFSFSRSRTVIWKCCPAMQLMVSLIYNLHKLLLLFSRRGVSLSFSPFSHFLPFSLSLFSALSPSLLPIITEHKNIDSIPVCAAAFLLLRVPLLFFFFLFFLSFFSHEWQKK